MSQPILARLARSLPELEVRAGGEAREGRGRDWSPLRPAAPLAVALPRSTAEVAALARFAAEHRLPLVPAGGGTGMSGGAVAAAEGQLIVAFDRMDRVLEFDPVDRTVRAQAGVITADLQAFAAERGLFFPVDFAAAGSSRVGGNLATNAGGVRVIRYGMTRDWVAGLTAVTGTGEVLEPGRGLIKDATGYDLRHLLIGSEGTLALITEATFRLTDPPGPRGVLLLAVPELAGLPNILRAFRDAVALNACEFFSETALAHVLAAHGELARPFAEPHPFYALLEYDKPGDEAEERALAAAGHALEAGHAADAVVAAGEADARRLWRLREEISESIAPRAPYKNDLSVRPSRVSEFLAALEEVVARRYPDFEIAWFGHIGDGNLHLNILRPEGMPHEELTRRCQAVNEEIFATVERFEGSISAEHGVGLLKKPYLAYSRSPAEIELMRAIKAAFDPHGILNPGKIFDREPERDA